MNVLPNRTYDLFRLRPDYEGPLVPGRKAQIAAAISTRTTAIRDLENVVIALREAEC